MSVGGRPLVSVCCAWFNRPDHVELTMDSLLSQNLSDFEIVVVNDGSTDPVVQEKLARYRDPRIRVIEQPNAGFVNAIRRAISNSSGKYIAIQGSGDVSLPGRLLRQSQYLEANPNVCAVGGRVWNVVHGGPLSGRRTMYRDQIVEPTLSTFLSPNNPISHGEIMIRRDAYDQVGGYRPFFRLAQDRDLGIRLSERWEIHQLDEFVYERSVFVLGGVAGDRKKLLLQQAYSAFARQCHFDRKRMGKDFVDMYGESAGLFRAPNQELAWFCAKQALECLATDDLTGMREFVTYARHEGARGKALAAILVCQVASRSPGIARLAKRLLKRHPRATEWQTRE